MIQDESKDSCSTQPYRVLVLILLVYIAVVVPVAIYHGRFPGDLGMAKASFSLTLSFVLMGLLVQLRRVVRGDRERPFAAIGAWWRRWWQERGPGAIIASLTLPALMTTFFMSKLVIPDLQPFVWDSRLAEADILLHGSSPWELMQPFLGIPAVTSAISLIYLFWFMLMFGVWVFWAMTDHPQRMRFLLGFMLCWIVLGTLAATVFSSAGPVFYAEVTGDPEAFAGLMRYLGEVDRVSPLPSLDIRDLLWRAYLGDTDEIATGISAMPSLHVAIVTLCAISG